MKADRGTFALNQQLFRDESHLVAHDARHTGVFLVGLLAKFPRPWASRAKLCAHIRNLGVRLSPSGLLCHEFNAGAIGLATRGDPRREKIPLTTCGHIPTLVGALGCGLPRGDNVRRLKGSKEQVCLQRSGKPLDRTSPLRT